LEVADLCQALAVETNLRVVSGSNSLRLLGHHLPVLVMQVTFNWWIRMELSDFSHQGGSTLCNILLMKQYARHDGTDGRPNVDEALALQQGVQNYRP
jgi:hypothetical protein